MKHSMQMLFFFALCIFPIVSKTISMNDKLNEKNDNYNIIYDNHTLKCQIMFAQMIHSCGENIACNIVTKNIDEYITKKCTRYINYISYIYIFIELVKYSIIVLIVLINVIVFSLLFCIFIYYC